MVSMFAGAPAQFTGTVSAMFLHAPVVAAWRQLWSAVVSAQSAHAAKRQSKRFCTDLPHAGTPETSA